MVTGMDEARLKEIENWFLLADWDTWDPTVNRPTFEQAERYGKDLIAALRDAWRERDSRFTLDEYTRATDAAKRHCERADRAVASAALLERQVELLRKNSEVVERVLHREIGRLEPIREAAKVLTEETCEDTVVVDGLECVTVLKSDYLNLCRALDAAEEAP